MVKAKHPANRLKATAAKHLPLINCLSSTLLLLALLLYTFSRGVVAQSGPTPFLKLTKTPPPHLEQSQANSQMGNEALVILYEQTDSRGEGGITSQMVEPERSDFDSQAADDFTIPPEDEFWAIERIEVLGQYSNGGPMPFVNVYLYDDMAGLPGSEVYSITQLIPVSDIAGDLVIDLPAALIVSPGTYWLSVQADMDADLTSKQWYWRTRTVQTHHPYVWRNPGGGFRIPACLSWAPGNEICGGPEADLLFRLRGKAPMPTAFESAWSSSASESTADLAWGDYDNDGDLDLVVGDASSDPELIVKETLKLYRNDAGHLTTEAIWESQEADLTSSLAWGDYDNDGDLDLAVGNGCSTRLSCDPNRIYRNDNGSLTSSAVWSWGEADDTSDVAWGDYDNDGDLDLAIGNFGLFVGGQPNYVYRNDGGSNGGLTPLLTLVWSSNEEDYTQDITWGDYDNDGDLDLLTGNGSSAEGQPNRLYHNEGGQLASTATWSSNESETTNSVAWGDYDNDGDLDLAIGNGKAAQTQEPSHLYRQDGLEADNKTPILALVWSWGEADDTSSVIWGDYDHDGDLDLAVSNIRAFSSGQPNKIYRNDSGMVGQQGPTFVEAWASEETEFTFSIAWGDVDGDGDLDLAVGNVQFPGGHPNRLYRNDGNGLHAKAFWASAADDFTNSVAWGDVDGDNDLDLVVGNTCTSFVACNPSYLYRNEGGYLAETPIWHSEEGPTSSVAWGDVDGDGDLDLAVGNADQPNQL